jgi:hypothetical protein
MNFPIDSHLEYNQAVIRKSQYEMIRFSSPLSAERYLRQYSTLDKLLAFAGIIDNSPRFYAALEVKDLTQEQLNNYKTYYKLSTDFLRNL